MAIAILTALPSGCSGELAVRSTGIPIDHSFVVLGPFHVWRVRQLVEVHEDRGPFTARANAGHIHFGRCRDGGSSRAYLYDGSIQRQGLRHRRHYWHRKVIGTQRCADPIDPHAAHNKKECSRNACVRPFAYQRPVVRPSEGTGMARNRGSLGTPKSLRLSGSAVVVVPFPSGAGSRGRGPLAREAREYHHQILGDR